MVCTDIITVYQTQLNMTDVNIDQLASAIKMMDGVKSVKVIGNKRIEVEFDDYQRCTVEVTERELKMTGYASERIKGKLKQYYQAIVQYNELKKDGYVCYMTQEGEKLRLQARR